MRIMRLLPPVLLFLGVLSLGCALGKGKDEDSATSDPSGDDSATEPDVQEDLDLLVILDYGDSMADVRADLADRAEAVVGALRASGDHWQVGVTTVAMNGDKGGSGTLVGAPVALDEAGAADALAAQLGCADCAADGDEQGLEAAQTAAEGAAAALFRGVPRVYLVISDEGDNSPDVPTGDDDPRPYAQALDALGVWTFHALGPGWDEENTTCLAGAQPWGVARYVEMADRSGGTYLGLTDPAADCAPTDPLAIFEAIGAGS